MNLTHTSDNNISYLRTNENQTRRNGNESSKKSLEVINFLS